MKLVIILTTFIYTFFPSISYANQDWTTYQKNIVNTITAIAIEGNTIWLGTYSGLAKYDKLTGASHPYTVDDGLIHNEINDIAVDHNGVKWIATNGGVSSFDGTYWTSYSEKELANNTILSVAVDHNNTKWFVSNDCVSRYNGEEWQIYKVENGLPVTSLTTIEVDKTNTKWIGTNKKGILSFNGNEWTLHDLYKPNVVSIAVDNDNTIWFGDFQGKVYSFNGIDWSFTQVISKFWFLYSLDVDSQNVLWVGTNKGLFRIKDGEIKVFTEENGIEKSICRFVKVGDYEEIWLAGHSGLIKYDGFHFKYSLPYTGPLERSIYSIAIDHNNVKWFGHKSAIITYYNNNVWNYITFPYKNFVGEGITVDNYNAKWFTAGRDGILQYNDEENIIKEYPISFSEKIYDIICIFSLNNVIWFGSACTDTFEWPGHIIRYDGKDFSVVFVYSTFTLSLSIDSKNNLWILTGSDLQYYDGVSFFPIPRMENNELPTYEIYLDKNDVLWGTSYNGLHSYDGNKWTHYSINNSEISSNIIFDVYADQNNTKWIGTDAGVSRFDGETWTTFNTKNSGIASNNVYSIAVEKNNTIWFGTDDGVSKYTGEVMPVSVDEEEERPEAIPIIKSYPNPFNPTITIEFSIPQDGFTALTIYNIAGQKVKELIAEYMTTGTHSAVWDGKDESGKAVSAGIYITRLKAGNHVATGKMLLVK